MTESRRSGTGKLFVAFALVVILFFSFGIIRLFLLRFEAGDIYPRYSSLRSDPLGVQALYESLQRCCGLTVWRNYQPFRNLLGKSNATVLFLGQQVPYTDRLPSQLVEQMDSFMRSGGRIVVSYLPVEKDWHSFASKDEKNRMEQKKNETEEEHDQISYTQRWGFSFASQHDLEQSASLNTAANFLKLPEKTLCRSDLYFKDLHPDWRVIYKRKELPVMIERRIGRGSLVLSAPTYFLSNEAMMRERQAGLVVWMLGGNKEIIFDEYFHGIALRPGVAALGRRYQLQWMLGFIVIFAGLYVWKNAAFFVPAADKLETLEAAGGTFSGKDSSAGLINLLRRNIPRSEVLQVCFSEWKKSAGAAQQSKVPLQQIDSIVGAVPGKLPDQQKAVEAYNRISELLRKK
jgi:hypothetical protein